jgi:mannitol/fructose-specific phosphotransferase system IIA component (Ntr-type)
MHLKELFGPGTVRLALQGANRDDILRELVGLLAVDDASADTLLRALQRRESLGSTGVGRGIAIPHARAVGVNKVRLAYGHRAEGVPYQAIDGLPVHDFFLIVAPPDEAVNMYLPVLGKIAQFAKDPDIPARLAGLTEPEQFLALLDEKGV